MIGGRSVITSAYVAKSLGYSPPEMDDSAHISCKTDMYCYGVVCIIIILASYVTINTL